jgi:hypothetical protein
MEATSFCSTDKKSISISWHDPQHEITSVQKHALSYWPTQVVGLHSRDTLLVAGKRRNGNTVIERWVVRDPLPIQSVDIHTGQTGPWRLKLRAPSSIEVIYDSAIENQDIVERFLLLRTPGMVLVQFWDSNNVYSFDATESQAQLQLVASPDPGSGGLHIPALTRYFDQYLTGDHETLGHISLMLSNSYRIVFVDSDRDGTVESFLTPSDQEWTTLGLGDFEIYKW